MIKGFRSKFLSRAHLTSKVVLVGALGEVDLVSKASYWGIGQKRFDQQGGSDRGIGQNGSAQQGGSDRGIGQSGSTQQSWSITGIGQGGFDQPSGI